MCSRVMNNWNTAHVSELQILAKRKKMKQVLLSVREATKVSKAYSLLYLL